MSSYVNRIQIFCGYNGVIVYQSSILYGQSLVQTVMNPHDTPGREGSNNIPILQRERLRRGGLI